MQTKIYRLLGIDTAMFLLRPGASWECDGQKFTRWEDERPCPSIEEVYETIDKIKAFEDSINTIYTDKQLEEIGVKERALEEAFGEN
jgi:hypothetical protein